MLHQPHIYKHRCTHVLVWHASIKELKENRQQRRQAEVSHLQLCHVKDVHVGQVFDARNAVFGSHAFDWWNQRRSTGANHRFFELDVSVAVVF